MSRYVLDTNTVSFILRDQASVVFRLEQELSSTESVFLACPMVWFEVMRGLLAIDASRQVERLDILFARFEWQDYTPADWSLAADLWVQRRAQGKPIADSDLLIAVFARNRGATLVTNNEKDFADLGLAVENWLSAG